jgi:hypothetical protein
MTDPEVKARLDEYRTCFPMKQPQPVKVVVREGDHYFVDWADRHDLPERRKAPGLQYHAIYFDDGSVFDAVNGWRPGNWLTPK